MIKGRIVPGTRAMALLATLREAGLHVVGIGGPVEIFDMTGSAIAGRVHELAVDMALRTSHTHVRAGQRKLCERIVIESCLIPRAAVVASLAGRVKASLGMRRVIGFVEVRHVAANACGRGAHEFATGMAGGAVQSGVRSDQGKASKFEVIKPRAHPVVHGVALFTGGGKIQGHVVQPGGFRVDEISLVAGHTRRRKTLELAYCGALVTGVAGDGCVRTNQGEAIQVLIDLLDGNIPALYRVALLAVGAHLALVDICMAGRALRAYIRKDWLGVALSARHALVHAA